ncbi:DUF2798 domain-containing protein [Ferrimonas aestuarii]|uniref:DUF2798 domain-containing protein n=1 Tax=Ferrimonas aestuarii TaxID=2569539 RepID=A0A4U1BR08_9GAMM|nr:DUF2798 domain-containing protein [Ferrimonas aestuarii]TKB55441.1 DUF2798 domain-containing protein [Ferrimonas aestuarii]
MTRIKTHLLGTLLPSIVMACTMSLVICAINTGFDAEFLHRWLRSFVIAWPIAFSLNLLVMPKVRSINAKLFKLAA